MGRSVSRGEGEEGWGSTFFLLRSLDSETMRRGKSYFPSSLNLSPTPPRSLVLRTQRSRTVTQGSGGRERERHGGSGGRYAGVLGITEIFSEVRPLRLSWKVRDENRSRKTRWTVLVVHFTLLLPHLFPTCIWFHVLRWDLNSSLVLRTVLHRNLTPFIQIFLSPCTSSTPLTEFVPSRAPPSLHKPVQHLKP